MVRGVVLCLYMVGFVVSGGVVRAQAADEPADPLAAARDAVAQAISSALADLGDNAYARREGAQALLEATAATPADELLRQVDRDDPEQLARAEAALVAIRARARMAELLLCLPDDQRQAVQDLEARRPGALAGVCGEDPDAVQEALRNAAQPQEPAAAALLAWAVRHPQAPIRMAAAERAAALRPPQPLLAGALCQRLQALPPPPQHVAPDQREQELRERVVLATALCRLRDERVLPDLVALLADTGMELYTRGDLGWRLLDAACDMDSPRLVATLMDRLERGGIEHGWISSHTFVDGTEVEFRGPLDSYICVVLAQTDQRHSTGFVWRHEDNERVRGFPSDAAREQALEVLRNWWGQNRDAYPAPLPSEE